MTKAKSASSLVAKRSRES